MKIRIELLIASLATKIRSGDLRQGPNLEADLRRTIVENELKEEQQKPRGICPKCGADTILPTSTYDGLSVCTAGHRYGEII